MTETPDHTAEIFKLLGSLSEGVSGLRRDFEKAEEKSRESRERTYGRLDEIGGQLMTVQSAAEAVKEDLRTFKAKVKDDVMPTVDKVRIWEQRGIGFLAAAGLVGTGFGALAVGYLHQYWDSFQKLLKSL